MQRMRDLKPGVQILLLLGAVVLLVAVAWGIGWLAHTLRSTPAESLPTATAVPSPPSVGTTAPPPTAVPVPLGSPTVAPVLPPTSTPKPTSPPPPTAAVGREVVQAGDRGLYDVCRRHCPALEHDFTALDRYAHRVAEVNNLPWSTNGPPLTPGEELIMPPCP